LESRFTHTTVLPGHLALAWVSVENWPAAGGAAAVAGLVLAGGGAVEGCVAGAAVERGVVGTVAVDGLAGAAAVGGVAGDGAAVVVEAPAGCARHSAMKSFFVFLLA